MNFPSSRYYTTPDGVRMRELVLDKPRSDGSVHFFAYRFEVGRDEDIFNLIIGQVDRRDFNFDWFDAAVLSHQLGQHLAQELKTYLPKKSKR